MGRKKNITVDDVRLILTLHHRGSSHQKIADVLSLSHVTVCDVIKHYNFFKEIEKHEA